MAKNWQVPGTDKGAEPLDWSGAGSYVLDADGADQIRVPDGGWILQAKFVRQGPDLLLVGKDGSTVLIKSFFKFSDPPDLLTPDDAATPAPLRAQQRPAASLFVMEACGCSRANSWAT